LPLDPAQIAGVELAISADKGANWSVYDTFPPTVLSTVIPELEIGEWQVSGVVVDTAGKRSKPTYGTIVVPDETAPGNLVSLVLTF
jgi:hypothetical protein